MWDPNVALGTVTHQNIGYLFPIGPVLLALRRASACPTGSRSASGSARSCSSPDSACCYLLRTLAVRGPGRRRRRARLHAQPVPLEYAVATRRSCSLAWAALPWMIALVGARAATTVAGGTRRVRDRRASSSAASTLTALLFVGARAGALDGATPCSVAREVDGRRRAASRSGASRCSRCSRRCGGSRD